MEIATRKAASNKITQIDKSEFDTFPESIESNGPACKTPQNPRYSKSPHEKINSPQETINGTNQRKIESPRK